MWVSSTPRCLYPVHETKDFTFAAFNPPIFTLMKPSLRSMTLLREENSKTESMFA